MSNTKSICITGELPFNWTSEMPAEDALRLAGAVASPSLNLTLEYGRSRYEENEHGGLTCVYQFTLDGTEAVSWVWLNAVQESINTLPFGCVDVASIDDLEG